MLSIIFLLNDISGDFLFFGLLLAFGGWQLARFALASSQSKSKAEGVPKFRKLSGRPNSQPPNRSEPKKTYSKENPLNQRQIFKFEHEKISIALENRHRDGFGNILGTDFCKNGLEQNHHRLDSPFWYYFH